MAINKFNNKWQLERLSLKDVKDVDKKLDKLTSFLNKNVNKHMYARCLNWLRMTKVSYKDESVRKKFDDVIEKFEDNKSKWLDVDEDPDIKLDSINDETLAKLYLDINGRKNSFQYGGNAPKDQKDYLKKLKDELISRDYNF